MNGDSLQRLSDFNLTSFILKHIIFYILYFDLSVIYHLYAYSRQ